MMIALNGNLQTADTLREHGLTPRYTTIWLGTWTRIENGRSPDLANELQRAKVRGLGVHVQLFYWGDSLTSAALREGRAPSTGSGPDKTAAGYSNLVLAIGRTLRDEPGVPALVNVETEWNKSGVRNDPAPFDGLFRDTAFSIRNTAPHAKIVSAPGGWEHSNLDTLMTRFPNVLSHADIHATQALFASGRHDRATYLRGPAILMDALKRLRSVIPDSAGLMVTDFAFSSHRATETKHPFNGDPRGYDDEQRLALEAMRSYLPEMRALGVTDIFARGVRDVNMALHNHFGYAERAWGVVTQDGKHKPAYEAFIALGSAAREPATSAEDVTFRVSAANEHWAQVRLGPTPDVAKTLHLVRGSMHDAMQYRADWGEWALGGISIPAGTRVRFEATLPDDSVAVSAEYEWPDARPIPTEAEPEEKPEDLYQENERLRSERDALAAYAKDLEEKLAKEIEKHGATRAALDKARESISAAIADLEEAYTEAGGGA